MTTRSALAPAAGVAIFLMIAAIGGGWLALGRVDPLLALPGAGWAAAVAAVVRRGRRTALPSVTLGASFALVGACVYAGAAPPLLPMSVTLGGLLVAELLAGYAFDALRARLPQRSGVRRAALLIAVIVAGTLWQSAAWRIVPGFYTLHSGSLPRVVLVTSLPLGPPGDIAAQLDGAGREAAILPLLRRHAQLTIADSVDPARLGSAEILLLAHPRALTPGELVAIDAWVRDGGKALVLADGLLSWPAPHALGDSRNPPVTSLLTPLLTHWGLALHAPPPGVHERRLMIGSQRLQLHSAGSWAAAADAPCRVSGPLARCHIGRGDAILLADADFIAESNWAGLAPNAHERGAAAWSSANARWLLDSIAHLAESNAPTALATPIWQSVGS